MVDEPGDDADAVTAQAIEARVVPAEIELVGAGGGDMLPQDREADRLDAERGDRVDIFEPVELAHFAKFVADLVTDAHDAALDTAPQLEGRRWSTFANRRRHTCSL